MPEPSIHVLKTLPEHYWAVDAGDKRVELRRDDRGFQVGDYLALVEWKGREAHRIRGTVHAALVLVCRVRHIVRGGPWLAEGYAALSIEHVDPRECDQALRDLLAHQLRSSVEAWSAGDAG